MVFATFPRWNVQELQDTVCECTHSWKIICGYFFQPWPVSFCFSFWSIKYLSMSSKRMNTGLNVGWGIFLSLPEDYKLS